MVLGPFAETKGSRRAGPKPRIPFLSVILDISNRGSILLFSVLFSFFHIPTRAITWRHLKAPAGVAAPQSRNQLGGEDCLSEASSAALTFRDRGKGTRRAAPGRQWFWVLLPKQKDFAVRGRNPAKPSPFCHPRQL